MTRATLAFGLCAAVLAVGCAKPTMTRFEYGTITLEAGGSVRSVQAKVASLPPPGILMMDGQPRQVTIEARIIDVQQGQALGEFGLWFGKDQLLRPTVVEDTTKRASPSNISFGVGTSIGGGDRREPRRGGHGPDCTCRECRGRGGSSSSVGTGVGIVVPGSGKVDEGMTSARVIFDITPTISLDGGYISIDFIYGRDPTGQMLVQPFLLPIIVTPDPKIVADGQRDVGTSYVTVNQDNTIALGGLLTDETKVKEKVPALGDIPLLNRLFASSDAQRRRSELLIIVTPRIILDDSD